MLTSFLSRGGYKTTTVFLQCFRENVQTGLDQDGKIKDKQVIFMHQIYMELLNFASHSYLTKFIQYNILKHFCYFLQFHTQILHLHHYHSIHSPPRFFPSHVPPFLLNFISSLTTYVWICMVCIYKYKLLSLFNVADMYMYLGLTLTVR